MPVRNRIEATDLETSEITTYDLSDVGIIISDLPVYVGPDETAVAVRTRTGGPLTLVRVDLEAFALRE